MLIVWALVPLLLVLLCYGFGLAYSLIIGKPTSFTFTTIIGFLGMAIIGSLMTLSKATAPYTAATFGAISFAGLVIAGIWFRSYIGLDFLPLIAGLITYVTFSLPTLAYGHPSWAGWIKLDDDSTFLAITDRLMKVGRSIPSPVLSTFDRVLQTVFDPAGASHFKYPVGTFIPFGVVTKLSGVEKAWAFQPYLSFAAAMVAALLVVVLRTRIISRSLVVVMAAISAMASTIYSYVMWGGVKEIVIIIPLLFFAISIFSPIDNIDGKKHYGNALIAFLGIYVVGGTAGIGYAAPILFIAVLQMLWKRNRRYFNYLLSIAGLLTVGLVLMLKSGNRAITNLFIPIIGDTGNLSRPLNMSQVFGIWPSQDFRLDPVNRPITICLIGFVIIFVTAGLYFSILKSKWMFPALVSSCVAVIATSYFWGGIWLTGKAIAVASPIFLLVGSIGIYELWIELGKVHWSKYANYRLQTVVVVLGVLAASGVVASDTYTYKNVWLAPYAQQDELRNIGEMFAGEGPTLMTEYSVYGGRYFLRNLGAEAASELRVHTIPTRDGNQLPRGFAADIDLFDPATIDYYNLLVLRKSPNGSRPPLDYNLAWSGQYYQVWKKVKGVIVRKTLPLGNVFYPGSVPTCKAVTTFLADRSKDEKIYTAVRKPVYLVDFTVGDLPDGWQKLATYSGGVQLAGAGAFNRNFSVQITGNYEMWIAGSYPGRLQILIDGRRVYSGHSVFESNYYLTNPLSNVELSAGSHVLTLIYSTPLLMPGSDSAEVFGPIYLSSQTAGDVRVEEVSASKIPQLCTQNLDWIAIAN